MTKTRLYVLPALLAWVLLIGCQSSNDIGGASQSINLDFDAFGRYWYQGKAEITSYNLEQYRYGEVREGEAVLIFVTEDFSRSKQVKLDDPNAKKNDAQKVLKLNLTKKFITGIYPYSMMLSVFTPVYDSVPAVKVTASSQEWCGHTFTQLNRQKDNYRAQLFSYFEKESDQILSLDGMPEDHLWTLLRLNPSQVPLGKLKLIPGLLDQRLTHVPLQAEEATLSMALVPDTGGVFSEKGLRVLTVHYQQYPRELRIFFSPIFPYEIAGWEEIKPQPEGQKEVSRAIRKASLMTDYWTRNKKISEPLRQELKLE